MSDTNAARDRLLTRLGMAPGSYDRARDEALLGAYRDEVILDLCYGDAREVLVRHRDQVLTEAAELIRQHRGDLDDDAPWWDTRDRDTAIRLLLAARTTTAQEQQ